MARSRNTADTQTASGGPVSPFIAGKNAVINGGFDFFQRSTFASQTANGYNLDRWYCSLAGTVTITQQTTGVPAGSKYCARVAYNAATTVGNLYQALESGTVATLQGQTVTLSAKLRRNATFAANLTINLWKNATADTLTGGTWSLLGTTTIANASLPTGTTATDWYLATLTVAIPNDGTANGIRITIAESATGASGAYWEAAQVQLELGSSATPFSRAGGTIQGELAACQRYYYRVNSDATQVWAQLGFGSATSTTNALCNLPLKVSLRAVPTSLDYANLCVTPDGLGSYPVVSAAALVTSSYMSKDSVAINLTSTGLTQYRPYWVHSYNNSNGYLGLNAEL